MTQATQLIGPGFLLGIFGYGGFNSDFIIDVAPFYRGDFDGLASTNGDEKYGIAPHAARQGR